MTRRPLAGRRILVTRAAHQAGKLSEALRNLGAEPVEVPVLEIRPPDSFDPLDQALRQLSSYQWLIFTSANAVRAFVERMVALGIAFAPSPSLKVAAVGAATARAADDAGFPITLVPESYVAESLDEGLLVGQGFSPDNEPNQTSSSRKENNRRSFDAVRLRRSSSQDDKRTFLLQQSIASESEAGFVTGHDSVGQGFSPDNELGDERRALAPAGRPGFVTGHDSEGQGFSPDNERSHERRALAPAENFAGQRILIARAAIARDIIPDALLAAGARVDVVDAYRNVLPESAPALLRQALARGIDAATFTSSSSVTHLAEAAQKAGIGFPFAGVPAISIGPITSQTLREAGWPPAAEAAPHDIAGLVASVAGHFESTHTE